MRPKITMEIGQATYDELLTLSETIGYPPEAALSYAVRLVNAATGVPVDMASSITRPKVSAKLGNTNTSAAA